MCQCDAALWAQRRHRSAGCRSAWICVPKHWGLLACRSPWALLPSSPESPKAPRPWRRLLAALVPLLCRRCSGLSPAFGRTSTAIDDVSAQPPPQRVLLRGSWAGEASVAPPDPAYRQVQAVGHEPGTGLAPKVPAEVPTPSGPRLRLEPVLLPLASASADKRLLGLVGSHLPSPPRCVQLLLPRAPAAADKHTPRCLTAQNPPPDNLDMADRLGAPIWCAQQSLPSGVPDMPDGPEVSIHVAPDTLTGQQPPSGVSLTCPATGEPHLARPIASNHCYPDMPDGPGAPVRHTRQPPSSVSPDLTCSVGGAAGASTPPTA
ncbi:hypothetical protein TREES_T100012087 [Tupaia chinensis]|uniref:Uncharacterized protein n=1 Tax=Tupaia chinensis TaxID=246437 RepID=L9K8W5_TUPCH|nr:hypothetical protein TREES_T100012087 [Tupaia chinensis]